MSGTFLTWNQPVSASQRLKNDKWWLYQSQFLELLTQASTKATAKWHRSYLSTVLFLKTTGRQSGVLREETEPSLAILTTKGEDSARLWHR